MCTHRGVVLLHISWAIVPETPHRRHGGKGTISAIPSISAHIIGIGHLCHQHIVGRVLVIVHLLRQTHHPPPRLVVFPPLLIINVLEQLREHLGAEQLLSLLSVPLAGIGIIAVLDVVESGAKGEKVHYPIDAPIEVVPRCSEIVDDADQVFSCTVEVSCRTARVLIDCPWSQCIPHVPFLTIKEVEISGVIRVLGRSPMEWKSTMRCGGSWITGFVVIGVVVMDMITAVIGTASNGIVDLLPTLRMVAELEVKYF